MPCLYKIWLMQIQEGFEIPPEAEVAEVAGEELETF